MSLIAILLLAATDPAPAATPSPAAVAGVVAGAVVSQPIPASVTPAADKDDPVICEREQELGSRLRARKVCMRKSEWEEQRHQNRQLIDRSQTQQPLNSGG